MKGAIGNAFILNMVITFILIFYLLLIGSMAYSKAYKTKNYLLNQIEQFEANGKTATRNNIDEWDKEVNQYLGKMGYPINTDSSAIGGVTYCPDRGNYTIGASGIDSSYGRYDYCIYVNINYVDNTTIDYRYNYLVLVYMKFDLPVIGQFIKVPITGETKTYTKLK